MTDLERKADASNAANYQVKKRLKRIKKKQKLLSMTQERASAGEDEPDDESPIFKTVSRFSEDNSAFPVGGVRHAIFFKGAELESEGAISKFGRKILINEKRWLRLVNQGFFKKISGE